MAQYTTDASSATWWPNLQPVQVAPPSGKICNWCKSYHLLAKFVTYASVGFWWQTLPEAERTQDIVALSDTHVFLLNEYFIELNTANFNILNKVLNWILSENRKLNQLLNWILLKNESLISVWKLSFLFQIE